MSKLAAHLIPAHWSHDDDRKLQRWQPKSIKVVDPDPNRVRRFHELCPHSLIVLRDHPKSEQKDDMARDPEGTGTRHADEWADKLTRWQLDVPREQLQVVSINEPNMDAGIDRTVDYAGWLKRTRELAAIIDTCTSAFLTRCTQHGIPAGALNLSVGWPPNLHDDAPPVWDWFPKTERALHNSLHMLVLHEYWSHRGPQHKWGWWAGRYQHCPWDVPILIGECGIDQHVAQHLGEEYDRRGWQHYLSAEQYTAQLLDYDRLLQADTRIHSAQVFSWDYAGKEWRSFELRDIVDRLPQNQSFDAPYTARESHTVHAPIVVNGAPDAAPPALQPPAPTGIIDPYVALAVLQVESGNRPFTDGLLTIRFEVHRFQVLLGNDNLFHRHFRFEGRDYNAQYWRKSSDAPWQHAHGSMAQRHELLRFARTLNDTAALKATGMGAAQIMGENHRRVGYRTVQAMFHAFAHDVYGVNAQVTGFFNYCLSDAGLLHAIRQRDWHDIATRYNGHGQQAIYAPLLANAVTVIQGEMGT